MISKKVVFLALELLGITFILFLNLDFHENTNGAIKQTLVIKNLMLGIYKRNCL